MKNPVRFGVCAFDKPDNLGGVASWLKRLLPELAKWHIEVHCFVFLHTGDRGSLMDELDRVGVRYDVCMNSDTTEARMRWLLARVRESSIDVFCPNEVVAGYWAASYVSRAGIPSVGVFHSDCRPTDALQEIFVSGLRGFRLDALVSVSAELERKVAASAADGVLLRRIGYGVPIPEMIPRRDHSHVRLAYVGRFVEEQKRVSDVARALCRAVREVPGCEAVLFGDGPERERIEAIIEEMDVGGSVRIGGLVDSARIQDELLQFDAIVLLSDYEGLPIALMEAMVCGCVPICTRMRSGIPELITHGVNGLLLDDRGDEFVAAVRLLAGAADMREDLGKAARERIIGSGLSVADCAKSWARLLLDLHAGASPKRMIRIPRKLSLGPVHPDLSSYDLREVAIPPWFRWYRRARIWSGRVRRILLGQPVR